MNPDRLQKSFLEAYDRYADALFRHCYYRVYSRETAKELVQETYMRAWDYVRDGNEVDNMRAFLYKVATNLIIDRSRAKKKGVEVSLDALQEEYGFDVSDGGSEAIEARAEGRVLIAFLQELDGVYREAVYMRYIDDLTPREIAEVTGESENIISVRIHRGLKKLRRLMEKRAHD